MSYFLLAFPGTLCSVETQSVCAIQDIHNCQQWSQSVMTLYLFLCWHWCLMTSHTLLCWSARAEQIHVAICCE